MLECVWRLKQSRIYVGMTESWSWSCNPSQCSWWHISAPLLLDGLGHSWLLIWDDVSSQLTSCPWVLAYAAHISLICMLSFKDLQLACSIGCGQCSLSRTGFCDRKQWVPKREQSLTKCGPLWEFSSHFWPEMQSFANLRYVSSINVEIRQILQFHHLTDPRSGL